MSHTPSDERTNDSALSRISSISAAAIQHGNAAHIPTHHHHHHHHRSLSAVSSASHNSGHGLGLYSSGSPLRHQFPGPSITLSDHDLDLATSHDGSPIRPSNSSSRRGNPISSNASSLIEDGDETPISSSSLSADHPAQPFSFQPVSMSKSPVIRSNISARRGHKYKHSSISLGPSYSISAPARPPLILPNSLPIPTLKEFRTSLTSHQKLRLAWTAVHMFIAASTAWNAHSSAALESLAHLLFYDSLGALLCVLVEVCANFEVWRRSSIRHPFGLQRLEVVAGFALAILLIFFGFDLISHNAKHALEGLGNHIPHHSHHHDDASLQEAARSVDLTVLLAITATLISAFGLENHARIGRAIRFAAIDTLPFPFNAIFSNPSHFLTLSCSSAILLLPLLDRHTYVWVDKSLSLSMALAMLILGTRLGMNVGSMLLMSYPGPGVAAVLDDIAADPTVQHVVAGKFWQAHYGVGMANLRVRVGEADESTLVKLRERIVALIRNRLSGGYGGNGQKWEVSLDFEPAHDEAITHGHDHPSSHGHEHGHGHPHAHTPTPSHGRNHTKHVHI